MSSLLTAEPHPLGRIEHGLLLGFLFCLPLLEAPKNLFWLAFVLLWLGRSAQGRAGLGGPWRNVVDLPFALFLATTVLTCLLAPPLAQRWNEAGDALRFALLGWLLARSRLTDGQLFSLLGTALLGTLASAAIGWWLWRIAGESVFFELPSVGHTNHSAIYLAMTALGTLGALLSHWSVLGMRWRTGLILALLLQSGLIVAGESRGALLAFCAGAFVLIWHLAPFRWRRRALVMGVLSVAAVLSWHPYLIDKTIRQWHDHSVATSSSYRVELARTALAAFRQYPLAGVGPGNFGQVSSERVGGWLKSRDEPFAVERYFHSGHAHSLYFNTLAERGLLGGVALLLLAAVWLRRLMFRPGLTTMRSQRSRLIWGCGMAGFAGVFFAGLFNTTLHHENGLLAMLALGLLIMDDRQQQWHQGK